MTALLEQFLSESRDVLQEIGTTVMRLEREPSDEHVMTELFRLVHTLKGNSGLFEFRELSRVLHAGEDLMDAVRQGRVAFSKELADHLLDAMDFVGQMCDEIEATQGIGAVHAGESVKRENSLRQFLATTAEGHPVPTRGAAGGSVASDGSWRALALDVPEAIRGDAHRRVTGGDCVHLIEYTPSEDCFFQGDDPFFQARGTPELLWGSIGGPAQWPPLRELDAYRCILTFRALSAAPRAELDEHFRYVADQVRISLVPPDALVGAVQASTLLAVSAPSPVIQRLSVVQTDAAEARTILRAVQQQILVLPVTAPWHVGRLEAAASSIAGVCLTESDDAARSSLAAATATAMSSRSGAPLLDWLDTNVALDGLLVGATVTGNTRDEVSVYAATDEVTLAEPSADSDSDARAGRRVDDALVGPKSLKVDQARIDQLMNLIGEMVVSKNALPYLADRAESVFGSRELSREIKAQHAVINRIVEEMQSVILQVRMMPVSFVFQRFPRLVRDTSRKLGKEVRLSLEGEETEADKNIVEALSDPLVHIVRNSLDHGFELPEARRAAGKPPIGTLTIRAHQEADRVVIDIVDDGKGIDPDVIKRKAYEKGIIDESTLERISDQDAINLVFAAGFSTLDVVSDLSGRGVGMDVVRTAIERVHGSVTLESTRGKGTRIRLALPLSMAISNVMVVESDRQIFGVPMDSVVETVRVPRAAVHSIKQHQATVLRGHVVPLRSINALLSIGAEQVVNSDDEFAVLVVRAGDHTVGLIVDAFRESMDVLLKPMSGVLAGLSAYSGSALMGDGAVLMVLNVAEIL